MEDLLSEAQAVLNGANCGHREGGTHSRHSTTHDSLLYARVETVLAGEIIDGDLKVGEQLPIEDSLIARSGQSHHRLSAIQNLVSRGLVEIRRRTKDHAGQ